MKKNTVFSTGKIESKIKGIGKLQTLKLVPPAPTTSNQAVSNPFEGKVIAITLSQIEGLQKKIRDKEEYYEGKLFLDSRKKHSISVELHSIDIEKWRGWFAPFNIEVKHTHHKSYLSATRSAKKADFHIATNKYADPNLPHQNVQSGSAYAKIGLKPFNLK